MKERGEEVLFILGLVFVHERGMSGGQSSGRERLKPLRSANVELVCRFHGRRRQRVGEGRSESGECLM